MKLNDGQAPDPVAVIRDGKSDSGLLRKKKSITRLFSTSSRSLKKGPNPVSPSAEDHDAASALLIPAQSSPLMTPKASPRIATMNFVNFMDQVMDHNHLDLLPTADAVGRGSSSTLPDRSRKRTIGSNLAGLPVRNFSEPLIRSELRLPGRETVRAVSAAHGHESEKPAIRHSPTFPLSRKRSETGMRMVSTIPPIARERGASVTHSYPKALGPHPLARPSTAGGEARPRPTGKRKPNERATGLAGASPFSSFEDHPQVPQRPWQADYSNDEVRASVRSALTTNSSHIDTTSTERSSIITKGTSFSESTVDLRSRPGSKAGGMTVDDAIEMYAAGFADDDDPDDGDSRDTSISEEDRRRSMKIAEAINDSLGRIEAPLRPPIDVSDLPNMDIYNRSLESKPSQPPGIIPCTADRDQYGFLKVNHYISVEQYDTWHAHYSFEQEKRTKKWTAFMRDHGLSTSDPRKFPNRSTKTERFIRKGIPPAWRGEAWFFYAGGQSYLKRHAGLYDYLVSRSEAKLPNGDKEAIERDLHRTFPDNINFRSDSKASIAMAKESPILVSLRRVLRAFAFHAPRIGYCQSLNFLTGLLLLFLPEEQTFWMLHIITTVYLPGTHETSLEGANVDLWVLMMALKSTMPNIWTKVSVAGTPAEGIDGGARLPPISLCTTSWFMSLFIGTLPIESVLRVWDVLFYEGSRTLFRVALTIFKLGEQRIKNVGDSMELFQMVQSLPRGMLDAGQLMIAVCRRGGVGAQWIEARRWERKEWYAKERARTLVPIEDIRREYFAQAGGDRSDTEALKRRDSIWRRKKRKPSALGNGQKEGDPLLSPQNGISSDGRNILAI